MKRNQLYIKIFLVLLVEVTSLSMTSCSEEEPEACYIEVFANPSDWEQITQTKATLSASISIKSGTITEYGFYLSNKRAELETAAEGAKKTVSGGNYSNFTYQATGLTPGTTYYYRAFASNGVSFYFGNIETFDTRERSEPVLDMMTYSNVTDNSVDLTCSILDSGEETTSSITYGFQYKKVTEANWTLETDAVQKNEDGSFSVTLTGLSPETGYNICAFAKNSYGVGYSNEEWIETSKKLTPELSMDDIDEWNHVTATGVKVFGQLVEVYSEDGIVSEIGFIYGTNNNLTYASAGENRIVVAQTGDNYKKGGTFEAELTNKLKPETYYYIRPYAKDEGADGTTVYGYGEEKGFYTRSFESPSLEWNWDHSYGNTTFNSISASISKLTYDGELVEYGFIWRKELSDYNVHNELTLDNCGENKVSFTPVAGEIVSSFETVIENLETNTTYEVKAYAISSYQVGDETYQSKPGYSSMSFTTADLNIPNVSYVECKNYTYTTLTLSSGIESYDETATLTECGFIWMDNTTYQESNINELTLENCGENKLVATQSENGAFESTLTGLQLGTTYQVAAYVTVTYSNGATRTGYYRNSYYTSSLYVSVNIDNIGVDSFTVSASVGNYWENIDLTELGDTFEAGFCWATSQETNPTTIAEENRVAAELTDLDGRKTFTSTITMPEESGVTYYVWAYIKYSGGIVYSESTSVKSKNIPEKGDHGNPEIKD